MLERLDAWQIMIILHFVAMLSHHCLRKLEDQGGKLALEKILFVVVLITGFLSLPISIVSLASVYLNSLRLNKELESKDIEINALKVEISVKEREVRDIKSCLTRYDNLIAEDRKRCRQEGYQEGRKDARVEYERKLAHEKFYEHKAGYLDGLEDYPLGINRIFEYESFSEKKNSASDVAKSRLASAITSLLSLSDSQYTSLWEFISLFSESVYESKVMTIEDIDTFIDWIFQSGYYVPDFSQYHHLGMAAITTHRIFVPEVIRTEISDWTSLLDRALNSGILFTTVRSAPSINLWNTELASLVPGLFDSDDQDLISILERIVQLAEEGIDDDANLPEYIARIAELPYEREDNAIKEISNKIERYLLAFAKELSITAETASTDQPARYKRIQRCAKRIDVVRDWRKRLLLSEELDEIKQQLKHQV